MNLEEQAFAQEFIRLATDGDARGWHERNGGNLSYRLTAAEIEACTDCFYNTAPWNAIRTAVPVLGGSFFLLTGSGKCMRNVRFAPADNTGIIEINAAGNAYRLVWGLTDGKPTSELPTHLAVHALKCTGGN